MPVEGLNEKSDLTKVAIITLMSIFILGYLNGMALNTYDLGGIVTSQTGNVVWIGLNAAAGNWVAFFENIGLFGGFILGNVFALFTQQVFKNRRAQFYFDWTIFILPIIAYPLLLQNVVISLASFIILGFAAGTGVGFFRKMYKTEVNNAMATGSVRQLGLNFANAFIKKDTRGQKESVSAFWMIFLCVFAFGFGAYISAIFAKIDYNLSIDTVLGISNLGYGRLSFGLGGYSFEHVVRDDRLAMGLGEGRVLATNITRVIGLIVICVIPYFLCPKYKEQN